MIPADTDPTAHEAQLRVYRHMGPEVRVLLTVRMSEEAREIALQGIRSRHPEYGEERARRALFRLVLGDDLARALWPEDALVPL
jgi:hypothetical protein